MADYSTSTQLADWLLDEKSLRERRMKAHAHAVKHCASRNDEPPLTLEDELEIIDHHERRIAALARFQEMPAHVVSTAVVYLKRFYVDHSVMMHNPSVISLLALYSAGKVEEFPNHHAEEIVIKADSYLNGHGGGDKRFDGKFDGPSADGTAVRVRVEALLNGELDFLQALNFQLVVFHPFHSLCETEKQLADASIPADGNLRQLILTNATQLCSTRLLHSDLLFTCTPGVIASAATLAAVRKHAPNDVESALNILSGDYEDKGKRITLISKLEKEISKLRKRGLGLKELKELELKRIAVRDPLQDPASEEYRAYEAEREEQNDKEERLELKKNIEADKKRAVDLLLGTGPNERISPTRSKRSRADAGLDNNDDEGRTHSPVRKRLSLRD